MAFRLAIEDRVAVQVKGKLAGATSGTHVNFNFTLDMERITQEQLNAAMKSDTDFGEFLLGRTKGWDGQRLVLDEGNNVAAFSPEAFMALLSIPGMRVFVYSAYMAALAPQEKNS